MKRDVTTRSMQEAEACAEIHQLLANPRRLMILWLLDKKERSVGDLAQRIGASLQSTSQHLRLLRERGLVCPRRDGQSVYYTIEQDIRAEAALGLDPRLDKRQPRRAVTHSKSSYKETPNV